MHHTLALSSIYLDIYCPHFPFDAGFHTETQTVGNSYALGAGGSGVIFSSLIAALGLKPLLLGKIGQDPIGQIVKNLINERAVSHECIESAQNHTNISVNYINPQGKNILTTVGDANQSLTSQEILPQLEKHIPNTQVLYLGSLFKFSSLMPHLSNLVKQANANKVITVLDHGRVTNIVTPQMIEQVKQLISQVDYYIPSQQEFMHVWEVPSVESGLEKLRQTASGTATIVTKDNQGVIGHDKQGNQHHTTPLNIKPVNSVGAGDTFNAGFIYATLKGKSFSESMDFAQKLAEFKISQASLPTKQDLTPLIQQ